MDKDMCEKLYEELCTKSKNHKSISHYTNLDSLEKIIMNRSFRLTLLSEVNDKFEDKRIPDLWKGKIYVSCFTNRIRESVMFWEMYTRKGKKEQEEGVMITLNNKFSENIEIYGDEKCEKNKFGKIEKSNINHKSYDNIDDWGYYDISFADIEYTNNFSDYVDKTLGHLFGGLVKGIEWDCEEETRIRVALKPIGKENVRISNSINMYKPKPNFEYIYFKLTDDMLNGIQITLNPWSTVEFRERVEKIMKESNIENPIIIDSNLKGNIKK